MRLAGLLRPRSIAVIGATPRRFVGRVALENCRRLGYEGSLSPVNPRGGEVAGIAAVASVAELSDVPDVVLVQVATPRVVDVVESAVAAGVRRFVIPGGGLTDSGTHAHLLHDRLRDLASAHDLEILGPNCMGYVDLVSGAAPYIGTVPAGVRAGCVGVVAQSGAVAELMVNAGGRVPLSTVVSTGSEIGVDAADVLEFFAEDEHTTAVLAFVEGLRDPERFLSATRLLRERGKQLAVTVVGESATSHEGITAHSGKLAAPYRVVRAAFTQAGALIADDLDQLLAYGEILGTGHWPRGPRTFVVTNSGGEGNLLADLCERHGLSLPPVAPDDAHVVAGRWPDFHVRNPLDPWGVDDYEEVYPAAIALAASQRPDILVVSQDQQRTSGEHERALGLDLARYLAKETSADCLRVLLSPTSQDPDEAIADFCRTQGLVHLRGATPGLTVLGRLAAAATATPTPAIDVPVLPVPVPRLAESRELSEAEALQVLGDLGVDIPRVEAAATPEDVRRVVGTFSGPVVVKGSAPGVLHKSALGLVRLGLVGGAAGAEAAREMQEAAALAGVRDLGFVVAEMVSGKLEAYVGYQRDATFGHTLLFGLGGVWTEQLDVIDVHVGLLDELTASTWLATTRVGRMLRRGGPLVSDLQGVAVALAAISRLVATHDAVTAIDLNPVLVSEDRAVAVDAVIVHHIGRGARDPGPSLDRVRSAPATHQPAARHGRGQGASI